MSEIINKVANSKLEVFDLEDYFPKEELLSLDIAQFLFEGIILKEKEFRVALKQFDWHFYKDASVSLHCSSESILPAWAFILVASHLNLVAKHIMQGTQKDLLIALYSEKLTKIDFSVFKDLPVILKGCSNKPVPQEIYVLAIQKLMPFAKSIMFGEACSAVPLFKKV
uniref:DUF2480 family protein n=1 Tax=Flavobacterium sp. TaxID=239 RepID=UPI004049FE56